MHLRRAHHELGLRDVYRAAHGVVCHAATPQRARQAWPSQITVIGLIARGTRRLNHSTRLSGSGALSKSSLFFVFVRDTCYATNYHTSGGATRGMLRPRPRPCSLLRQAAISGTAPAIGGDDAEVSDRPCNVRREGWQSLVI